MNSAVLEEGSLETSLRCIGMQVGSWSKSTEDWSKDAAKIKENYNGKGS